MRILSSLIFSVAISTAVVWGQTVQKWVIYESVEGRYSVSLPAEPKLADQEADDASGKKLPQYLATVEDGNAAFIVGHFDYDSQSVFSLDKARDGLLANIKGTLISEESARLETFPGRSLVAEAESGSITFLVRARFFDAAGRVYVLQFILPKVEDGPSAIAKSKKFFDSFRVMKAAQK